MVKKFFFLFIVFAFSVQVLFSQEHKTNGRKMKLANSLYEFYDFKKALDIYLEIFEENSSDGDLNFKIGICINTLGKNRKTAIPFFKTAANKGIADAFFYLGNLYHLESDFDKALSTYNLYKRHKGEKNFGQAETERLIAISQNAIQLMENPVNVNIKNMGEPINSKYPDYAPLISADETVLIYTSRREGSTGGLTDPYGEYFEDIYISYKVNNEWTEPIGISKNINTNTHDASVALSADGENLFIYRTSENLISGDLYESKFDGKDWSLPEKLGSDINTEEGWEASASISADGKIFYFSSNRPGGYGGKDLYRVVKLPDGKWSKSLNLGPTVNSAYDDDSPFIHPDGKTLYFSSKGHKTMGGFDIFKTVVAEDGEWSSPENLGYPINSVEDDIFFVLSVNGDVGYYSSKKTARETGESNIYQIQFSEQNFELAVLKGTVHNMEGVPISASITLIDEESNAMQGLYHTNKLTGKFIMIVTPGKMYKVIVEAQDHYPYTEIIDSQLKTLSFKLKEEANQQQ